MVPQSRQFGSAHVPLCDKKFNPAFFNACTTSPSILPVIAMLANVREAALTPSNAPERHSSRKSAGFVDLGVTSVPREESDSQASLAFWLEEHPVFSCWSHKGSSRVGTKLVEHGGEVEEENVLVYLTQE